MTVLDQAESFRSNFPHKMSLAEALMWATKRRPHDPGGTRSTVSTTMAWPHLSEGRGTDREAWRCDRSGLSGMNNKTLHLKLQTVSLSVWQCCHNSRHHIASSRLSPAWVISQLRQRQHEYKGVFCLQENSSPLVHFLTLGLLSDGSCSVSPPRPSSHSY